MIFPTNEAVTASFMVVGMTCNDDGVYDQLIERWENGCFELHFELCKYATLSEQIVGAIQQDAGDSFDFPGVYDYEVSEPFGRWFRGEILSTGSASFEEAKAHLIELACRFFSDRDDAVYQRLCKRVCEALP